MLEMLEEMHIHDLCRESLIGFNPPISIFQTLANFLQFDDDYSIYLNRLTQSFSLKSVEITQNPEH